MADYQPGAGQVEVSAISENVASLILDMSENSFGKS